MIRRNPKVVILAVTLAAVACRGGGKTDAAARSDTADKPRAEAGHDEHGAVKPAAAHAGHGAEDGHGHGKQETSDLDRPLDELFAATCEHGKKTHECDDCRYGVGVVRVPRSSSKAGS
jgi:cobalt-zinc-cadmium efflux system membrane fusion protein